MQLHNAIRSHSQRMRTQFPVPIKETTLTLLFSRVRCAISLRNGSVCCESVTASRCALSKAVSSRSALVFACAISSSSRVTSATLSIPSGYITIGQFISVCCKSYNPSRNDSNARIETNSCAFTRNAPRGKRGLAAAPVGLHSPPRSPCPIWFLPRRKEQFSNSHYRYEYRFIFGK